LRAAAGKFLTEQDNDVHTARAAAAVAVIGGRVDGTRDAPLRRCKFYGRIVTAPNQRGVNRRRC